MDLLLKSCVLSIFVFSLLVVNFDFLVSVNLRFSIFFSFVNRHEFDFPQFSLVGFVHPLCSLLTADSWRDECTWVSVLTAINICLWSALDFFEKLLTSSGKIQCGWTSSIQRVGRSRFMFL